MHNIVSVFTTAVITAFTVQESLAAANVDCKAIHAGLEASYVKPPKNLSAAAGKVLTLDLSGETALATGIDSITFSLPKSTVTVRTPKSRGGTTDKNLSVYALSDAYKNPPPQPKPNEHNLECLVFKKFFFSCASAQQYEPVLQGNQPNTIFSGEVKYKLGPCEGSVFAPALNQ